MTSREIVAKTIRFGSPDRMPYNFPEKYGTDFAFANMSPSPDDRPMGKGTITDEWGAVWDNIGICKLGEVKECPLEDWKDFPRLRIPDIRDPQRWKILEGVRDTAGDKFLLAGGISIYERVHFIRGLENTWTDIYQAREQLCELIDILVEMNLFTIEKYAQAGVDGLIFCDDWGLQDRLMISPDKWRQIWKPRYERIYSAAHDKGMYTFLHSCGYIVDILDDLIEIGLDVIHMDQQMNMGLKLLGSRFGGRITFFSPADIQAIMTKDALDDIRIYCQDMVKTLGRPNGGFIPRWYEDPVGAGHSQEAVDAMCEEFLRIKSFYSVKD